MNKLVLHRLLGLVRTRVVISIAAFVVMYKQPSICEWVVSVSALAMGVSAVDAWKGKGNGLPPGDTH